MNFIVSSNMITQINSCVTIYYIKTSEKFCNILLVYLLYSSSYNKSSLPFKVEVIVLNSLKPLL